MEAGLTVLLPKTLLPEVWGDGDTRPLRFTSALLKWTAQLLLHNARLALDRVGDLQWAIASNRTHPGCDWWTNYTSSSGTLAKTFGSFSQLHLAELIADEVGRKRGQPCEAIV